MEFLNEFGDILIKGTMETLYMTFASVFFAYLFGLPMGVALVVSDDNHIMPSKIVNRVLGTIVNITRSVPFIILLIAVIPFTRMVVGTAIGANAAIVPLVIGATPFVARMVESSLKELNKGIIEAAASMGCSNLEIIYKVMIPESMPSLVLGSSITTITLVGYSAMAGAIGAGGLGDLAIRYGYYRYESELMLVTIVVLVLIVQAIQFAGNHISKKINRLY
ncbi:methionine ABC transporter permease [Alkalibacter saccharofermentans]|uniref:D-methionine transport system permease protein n=1 Tax=Alkalibacter saccharofermentans DSM 14828 TaxID=1120975 RepID=A0A1M4YN94_9FIRM|nr:methionine ABC transporter permease [Alkalibacter saccharofermentans]SHF07123.1 D-methionine transport system permease protein [Alkalibacter saccharofermentans DSM 14828]